MLFEQQIHTFTTVEAEDEGWDPVKLINKGIEFINLHSIFNDILIILYRYSFFLFFFLFFIYLFFFETMEPPIIC